MELCSIVPEGAHRLYTRLLDAYGIMREPPTETVLSQFDTTHLTPAARGMLLEEKLGHVWQLPSFHGDVTNTLIYRGIDSETGVLVRVYRAKGRVYGNKFKAYNVHELCTPDFINRPHIFDRLKQPIAPPNFDGVWHLNLDGALIKAFGALEGKFNL